MRKAIVVLAVIVLLGGAAYVLWGNNRFFQISFLDARQSTSTPLVKDAQKQIRTTQEKILGIGSHATQWIGDTTQSFIDSVMQTAKDEIHKKVQATAQGAYQSIGEKIGMLDTNTETNNDFLIRYITKPGVETFFIVENTLGTVATGTLDYRIVWGDGNENAQQNVPVQPSYLFSHTWVQAGEYDIEFQFIYKNKKNISNAHIHVKE